MKASTSVWLALAAALLSLAVGFAIGRRSNSSRAAPTSASRPSGLEEALAAGSGLILHVPHAEGNIVLDGDLDDPGWIRASARTRAFVGGDGVSEAHPFTEARFVWGDGFLYVGLYAADEDLHAKSTEHDVPVKGDDVFHVIFTDGKTDRVLELNPLGTLVDGTRPSGTDAPLDKSWESGAHVSHEVDGTPNRPSDHDEEWVIEMAIPLERLGLRGERGERIGVALRRCDTTRSGVISCGTWGEGSSETSPRKAIGVLVLD